ncbi:hypothetical protein IFM12275_67320 [Nocardia sputorum]|uniref:Uncharacterized protein n=1 Tax=Nocardia sputorum TaxID=2984338 RepID=A0ABN6U0H6_9NOCA|nr:hypothetical protein IFM12275_67320 [Nocardia sputorum]BDT98505.1 hypothetical protein IFM12276_15340 [Nocardia sputorum]
MRRSKPDRDGRQADPVHAPGTGRGAGVRAALGDAVTTPSTKKSGTRKVVAVEIGFMAPAFRDSGVAEGSIRGMGITHPPVKSCCSPWSKPSARTDLDLCAGRP